MNARQKAKKYKQELEMLKKQTIKPFYIEREPVVVDTFVSEQVFSTYPYVIPDEEEKRILLDQLIHDPNFLDSVVVKTRHRDWNWGDYGRDQVVRYIELKVIRR